jgi:hypothetical protein
LKTQIVEQINSIVVEKPKMVLWLSFVAYARPTGM